MRVAAANHPDMHDGDRALVQSLLELMQQQRADFTLTFRALADSVSGDTASVRAQLAEPAAFDPWYMQWRARLAREGGVPDRAERIRRVNPIYIPRNHRIEQVIDAAVARADFSMFAEMLGVVTEPYREQPQHARYAQPPTPSERVLQTFCGT